MEKKSVCPNLNEKDEIRVVGIGTKNYYPVIRHYRTGNSGVKEYTVFEGSFIQVGSKIFAQYHTQYEAGESRRELIRLPLQMKDMAAAQRWRSQEGRTARLIWMN